jgi:hypothetical protein
MASTYTTNLGLELQATGENRASWGSKTNTNLTLIEEALSAMKTVAMADADITLSKISGGTDQSRPMFLRFTGTLTAGRMVTIPTVSKFYFMQNSTTGGFNLTISTGSSTFVLAPAQWKLIFTDGVTLWSSDSLFSASSATRRWDIVGAVDVAGTMEIGKAIDFHNANSDATDYAVRLETGDTTTDLYVTGAGQTGKKIWNSGNDGAASGLDADLLDGLHANQIYTEPPNDGKLYVRRTSAGVSSWVAIDAPWSVDPANNEVVLRFGANTVIRIKASGLIMTEDDIEVFSTSVGV